MTLGIRRVLLAVFLTIMGRVVPPVGATVTTAYSNLSGVVKSAYSASALYNSPGAPFTDVVRGNLILDDVVVDASYRGQFAVGLTVNFYKSSGFHQAPQIQILVYDASGPNGGPGLQLYSVGGSSSTFPVTGEGTLTVGGSSPLFQVPTNGRMWIGYQFSSFAPSTSGIPALSPPEVASIGTSYYGPSEIGTTLDGIWISDLTSMGTSGPPKINPAGMVVSEPNLNLGLKLTVDVPAVTPPPSVSYTNPLGTALGTGHAVGFDQFLGTRFTLASSLDVSRIDLTVAAANNQNWFVAIVALASPTSFPTASASTGLADLGQVRMSKVFNPGPITYLKVVSVPVSVKLGPGSYAVMVGTGLFGSPTGFSGAYGALQNYNTVSGSDTIAWVMPSTYWFGPEFDFLANGTPTYGISIYGDTFVDLPVIDSRPQGGTVVAGQSASLSAHATAYSPVTYQWRFNGRNIVGATSPTLTLPNFQPENEGGYDVVATTASGSVTSPTAVLGVPATTKLTGSAFEIASDIRHPNGNIYDQILLTGAFATVKADPGQVTRVSFIDLTDDIVQVEFSGAGSMSIALASASGPALPVKYNQNVSYMKGQATIAISGADETTNVSVFSVGRANATDQTLFRPVTYDGYADVELLTIQSSNGNFGGVRAGNASFFSRTGTTGILAPGVGFTGPVYLSNVSAFDTAAPAVMLGSSSDVRVTGGDFLQPNGRAVQVGGITKLNFVGGSDSHGTPNPAKANRARFEQDGVDLTAQIVVNPAQ